MTGERTPAVADDLLSLVPTRDDEFAAIAVMEQDADTARFVTPDTEAGHRAECACSDIVYRSLLADGRLVGFVILVLDPDGTRVELRRIVVTERGRGYGVRTMALIERVCTEQIGRHHIWLDVFDFNPRAQRVYERTGYRVYGEVVYEGDRHALLMDKRLDSEGD